MNCSFNQLIIAWSKTTQGKILGRPAADAGRSRALPGVNERVASRPKLRLQERIGRRGVKASNYSQS